jgi:hypothetical protein
LLNFTGDFDKMGGTGSGRWNAEQRRTTANAFRLDVGSVNRDGALEPGCVSGSHCSTKGMSSGYVDTRAEEGALVLTYKSRNRAGVWSDHEERVRLSWEACRFGGRRPFFHCPECDQRILILYGRERFLCRTCHGLFYPSQHERGPDRAIRRANRIRTRLGAQPGLTELVRPKGMHRRTYERLARGVSAADGFLFDHILRLLERNR